MNAAIQMAALGSTVEFGAGSPISAECELIRQLRAGSESAYRTILERYQTRIIRLAQGVLGNREEAEEIAQLVFVKVFLSIAGFGGRCSLFTWMYRIAVNECFAVLRKRGRAVSLDETLKADYSALGDLPSDPSDCENTLVQRDYLNRLLANIPTEDRQLLLLREVEGLSIAELAQGTGTSVNAVKIRLCRARQHLANAASRWEATRNRRPGWKTV